MVYAYSKGRLMNIYLRMKLLLLAYLFSCQYSFGQSDSTIYFKEFGWTIKLPSDLKIVEPEVTAEQPGKPKKIEGRNN